MRLREWLQGQGKGATARLARVVGTRWATIHDIAGGHVPKAPLAKRIEAATDGAVTAAELLGLADVTATTVATNPPSASAGRA